MSHTPEAIDAGSSSSNPANPPPIMSTLDIMRTKLDQARRVSAELQIAYQERKSQVEPEVEPDQEKPVPDRAASLELAELGIKLATQQKAQILIEREVAAEIFLAEEKRRRMAD